MNRGKHAFCVPAGAALEHVFGYISKLIHKVPEVIAHRSNFYHLQPGDLIYTGTPEGVGPVASGDLLEGTIEGVGTISLTIGPAE